MTIKSKRQPKILANYLSIEVARKLLKQPDITAPLGKRDAMMLTLLYDTAARVSEIINVRFEDIRLESPAIIRLHGKGNKTRIVPLSFNTVQLFSNYLRELNFLNSDFLFKSRSGRQLTRGAVWDLIKKYVTKLEEENPGIVKGSISPHVLRHTKAMHLLEAGIELIYIRDFLGHDSIQTTKIYARTDSKRRREALEKSYVPNLLPEPDQFTNKSWNEDEKLMRFLTELQG